MAESKNIWVYADWVDLKGARLMGQLKIEPVRGKDVFSFHYEKSWLDSGYALTIDPDLGLFTGPQYIRDEKVNFGIFTDSSPDRWGKLLMKRREALLARQENRKSKVLLESDYLMGVFDLYRMGGIRYKLDPDGPFVDDNAGMAAPPLTSLRTLEAASLELEKDDSIDSPKYGEWMNLLLAPGSSLGGARPKASVIDAKGHLWIAKFPSHTDDTDIGAWEAVVNNLAISAGINVSKGRAERFTTRQHTYLTKRFDRADNGERIHFASAMTMLGYTDGADGGMGVSYLELAEFITRNGASPDQDLEELWKRIVFNICVNNTDDHLRNHGFLWHEKGWTLSPAYDINPVPIATGLTLNINEDSNELSIDLAREVATQFRVSSHNREIIIDHIIKAVNGWQAEATKIGIPRREIQEMERAFDITTKQ
ncbi:serine/threonine-protein kinase HipA [Chitinophaga sp. CF118]|uniref:type II toxin-antitoxin system HipA family toxin n=1 Tax=Chitinophaga sp. CF118 TaxID=1884367 RepID=UPI0008F44C34|nr:HipA domain-containing protein [Chitinophaga sp. CF118]SFE97616.1 serine/threonine-protein kinase HipA [Chitinophaga sp. CF118]